MVTTLRLDRVRAIAEKQIFSGENWRPEAYMSALRYSGFTGVTMEDKQDRQNTFQVIYATASKQK